MSVFQKIEYTQSVSDASTFLYIPVEPLPETLPSGANAITLINTGEGGIVQLGAHFDLSTEQTASLIGHIRQDFPELTAPVLQMQPLTVKAVELTLIAADGAKSVIAKADSSGVPPYAALFNVTLDKAAFNRVLSASTGRTGILLIHYLISISTTLHCTATLAGDISQDLDQPDPIQSALSAGRLVITADADDGVSESTRNKAIATVNDLASAALARIASGATDLDAAHLRVSATQPEDIHRELLREADLSSWLSGGKAQIFGASTPDSSQPVSRNVNLKLGFEAKDLPIAFVKVASGSQTVALQSPMFSAGPLTVSSSEPVEITTNYTDGGPAYHAKLAVSAESVALDPADLGFCSVLLDASALKHSGAAQVKINVKYRPSGNGTADDRTMSYRFGDWTDTWYVISRDVGLGGSLEYSWKQTGPDGVVSDHPSQQTDQPEIRI